MTVEQLKEALLARAPGAPGSPERERWNAAAERLAAAALPPECPGDLAASLPPQPRYVGPGPWFDAIKDGNRR